MNSINSTRTKYNKHKQNFEIQIIYSQEENENQ